MAAEAEPFEEFWEAETYHKDYYDKNRSQACCRVVIDPKIRKLLKDHKEDVK